MYVALCLRWERLLAAGSLVLSGGTYTWTATAVDDALVDGANTGTNYGSDTLMKIDQTSAPFKKFYMRFDLPDNAQFTSTNLVQALLTLTVDSNVVNSNTKMTNKRTRIYGLYEVYDTWAENTITWNEALGTFANVKAGLGDQKYFNKSNGTACLDGNATDTYYNYYITNGVPATYVAEDYWQNTNPWPYTCSFGLITATTSGSGYGVTTPQQTDGAGSSHGGGDTTINFRELIYDDTDNSLTLMVGPNNGWEALYSSDANVAASSKPTLTITFVPEPATLTMLCLGGLALIRRRRS